MKFTVFPKLPRRGLVRFGVALLALGVGRALAGPVAERRILVIGDSQAQGLAGGFLPLCATPVDARA